MRSRYQGMIEIVAGIMGHADVFHHTARRSVRGHGQCNNLRKIQALKSKAQYSSGGLSGVALIPVLRCDTPANFHTRSEVRFESRYQQSNASDEWINIRYLNNPKSEAVPGPVRLDTIDNGVTLLPRQHSWKTLHHAVSSRFHFEIVHQVP
jgi:hypothetical protein